MARLLNSKNREAPSAKSFDDLPDCALIRIKDVLELIPLSSSAWWEGVRFGRYPKGFKLGAKTTVWRVGDIRAFLADLQGERADG